MRFATISHDFCRVSISLHFIYVFGLGLGRSISGVTLVYTRLVRSSVRLRVNLISVSLYMALVQTIELLKLPKFDYNTRFRTFVIHFCHSTPHS